MSIRFACLLVGLSFGQVAHAAFWDNGFWDAGFYDADFWDEDPPPTFDANPTWVSATATAETVSFDASANTVTWYGGLFAFATTPTFAEVKAGTGDHNAPTSGATTGSSQNVAITSTDSPVWAYYRICVGIENTGGNAVSCIPGTYGSTQMDPPAGDNWVQVTTPPFTGGLTDGASPAAVAVDDVLSTSLTSLGYTVLPLGDGDFIVLDGGDPLFQTFEAGLFRRADQSWEFAEQSLNNTAPALISDPLCSGGPIFGELVFVEDEAITDIVFPTFLFDADGHTITVTRVGGDALPPGLALTMSTLSGTPTTIGQASVNLEGADAYGGVYPEACPMNIVSGLVPDVVGETEEDAGMILSDAFYDYSASEVCNELVADGSVISQDPEAGEPLAPGNTVNLLLSRGECGGALYLFERRRPR